MLFGIFMYSDGSVSACRSKAYECISDCYAAFWQELQLQEDSFQSQRHTPRHLQRRYRCSTIRRLSLPPCWALSFATDTGLSKCDRICYNNRQCNFLNGTIISDTRKKSMNYAGIKYCDIANGLGCRTVLFVSGCRNHCKGCFSAADMGI